MRYLLIFFGIITCCTARVNAQNISLPLAGNAYSSDLNSKTITKNGIENWKNPDESFDIYFRVNKKGNISIKINKLNNVVGKNTLSFAINTTATNVVIDQSKLQNINVGNWNLTEAGYVKLSIKRISKDINQNISIESLQISGTAIDDKLAYVKNNEGNFYYWGRRGPSVHFSYQQPKNVDAEWFYNEVTVPEGNDIIGSYYMANGFAEGYFGMQVNSKSERRILFSVWSSFETDNPKSIPDSDKIKLISKGEGVYAGEFGNEGSGGQSYLRYNWKAGNTYKFLLHASPGKAKPKPNPADGTLGVEKVLDGTTTYTAYFFAPEIGKWQLIASFERPKTQTYLKRFHSFLENFSPNTGAINRKVLFNSQWICDSKGNWIELNTATFTIDNTGHVGYRMDYQGGKEQESFYLKNCGFFNDYTISNSIFTRKLTGNKPNINLWKLPNK